jgi:hypothetical protein
MVRDEAVDMNRLLQIGGGFVANSPFLAQSTGWLPPEDSLLERLEVDREETMLYLAVHLQSRADKPCAGAVIFRAIQKSGPKAALLYWVLPD